MSPHRVVVFAVALVLSMTWAQVNCLVAEELGAGELGAENRSLSVSEALSHGLPLVFSQMLNLGFGLSESDGTGRYTATVYPAAYPDRSGNRCLEDLPPRSQVRYTVDTRFCRFEPFLFSAWRPIAASQIKDAMREVRTESTAKLPEPFTQRSSGPLNGFRMYFHRPEERRLLDRFGKDCIVDVYAKRECEQEGQLGSCTCLAGYKSGPNDLGGVSCLACAPGTYNPSGNTVREFCDECPAGSKCNREGMTAPLQCLNGESCPKGTGTPARCAPGYVCRAGAAPQLCPEGSYCPGDNKEPEVCVKGVTCAPGSSQKWGQGFLDDSSVSDGARDTSFTTLVDTRALGASALAVDCKGGLLLRFKMRARLVEARSSGAAEMAWSYDCGLPLAPRVDQIRSPLPLPRPSTPGIAEAANANFDCGDGYAMTGFNVDYSVGSGVTIAKCSKVDTVPGSCRTSRTPSFSSSAGIVGLVQSDGQAVPNSLASLSSSLVSCKSGALQGFKVLVTNIEAIELATIELTCCDLKDGSPYVADLAARLANATTQVTQCGVRHGWITPADIRAELTNTTLSPSRIEDRLKVFSDRAALVLKGMNETFTTPNAAAMQEALHKLLRPASMELDLRVISASKLAGTLAAGCPGAPTWSWVPVCTSRACTFSLTQTVTQSWESGSYQDFAKTVSEESSESYGQALSIGKGQESGSSTTQSDTYSASITAGFEVGFASGSVELGYSRSQEAQQFGSQSITSDTTRTMDLSLGTSKQTSDSVGKTLTKVLSQEKSETCETSCDGVLYQWTMKQLSPAAKEAKVTTCIFVCRAPDQGLPVCPGGRCANDQCSICLPDTFKERAMDELYSGAGDKTKTNNLPMVLGIGLAAAVLLGAGAAVALLTWRRRAARPPARGGVTDLSYKL